MNEYDVFDSLCADVSAKYSKEKIHASALAGAENSLFEYVILRLGYRAGYDIGTYTAGVSLELFRTKTIIMRLDYGYAPYDDFRDTHKISLRAQFGRTQ